MKYEKFIDINDEISQLAENLPKTGFIDMKMVLIDIYETYFEIYDHLGSIGRGEKARPLASVALHEIESIGEGSDLYLTIDRYFEKNVFKHTGLKLHEFLNYPREYTILVYKNIDKINIKDTKDADAATALMNNSIKQKK